MSIAQDIYAIRSKSQFSHDNIKNWIVDIFKSLFSIDISEIGIEIIIHGSTEEGRADVIVEDDIGIEVKKNLSLELDDAKVKSIRLLEDLKQKGAKAPIVIMSDGIDWKVCISIRNHLFEIDAFSIEREWSDEKLKQRIYDGIILLRLETSRLQPSAEKISQMFRPDGPAFRQIRQILVSNATQLIEQKPHDFTAKFLPWFEVFTFVYNNFPARCESFSKMANDLAPLADVLNEKGVSIDNKRLTGALELFFRHTLLSLLAKVLAELMVLGHDELNRHILSSPKDLISGETLRVQGVFITSPNDFFEWVSLCENLKQLLVSVIAPLKRFSNEFSDDVFRHLYESIVDAETRHELGEFFTPRWLAELIVSKCVRKSGNSVLDSACGSGTFLVATLNRKVALARTGGKYITNKSMTEFLDDIYGIDVNPLSVLLAKTNLYLAAISILGESRMLTEFHPNIYVADTFILSRFQRAIESKPESEIIYIDIANKLQVPILKNATIDDLQKAVDLVSNFIETKKSGDVKELSDKKYLQEYYCALYEKIIELKQKYGDNIWNFVLRNYVVPPMLRNKFDVVVGNPPWLVFREAKSDLQKIMESVMNTYDIKPNVKVKTSFNLSVAFFITSSEFLKNNGKIGFVLPLSALESGAHLPFITMLTKGKESRLNLEEVYDFSEVHPAPFPHTLAACAIIAEAMN